MTHTKNKTACCYIRYSTSHQGSDTGAVTSEVQEQRVRDYCEYKGYELTNIIRDEAISGGINKNREGFCQLLDIVESGNTSAVVLFSLERLSRDMLTMLALERLLNEYDVELHTIEGQISTETPDGFLSFAMKAFLGEIERRQVKYRTRKAMEYKKSEGHVVGSIPYGYVREGNVLAEVEHEQVVIQLVNRLHGEGATLSEISRTLKSQNITTRAGKVWKPEQIKRLIDGYEDKWKKIHEGNGS
jgi:site-specific DNA recombinase